MTLERKMDGIVRKTARRYYDYFNNSQKRTNLNLFPLFVQSTLLNQVDCSRRYIKITARTALPTLSNQIKNS